MKVTRRQLELLVKEASAPGELSVLTEAELHEIAPIIGAIAGIAGRGLAAVGKVFTKGISGVAKAVTKSPKMMNSVRSLLTKAKVKMPKINKFLQGIDLESLSPEMLSMALQNAPSEVQGDLEKVIKNAADGLKKAEDCACPTADALEKAEDFVEG